MESWAASFRGGPQTNLLAELGKTGADGVIGQRMALFRDNWLRVLGATELAQIDQRVRHQFHAIVPLLDTFKAEQEPLEFVFPRKGPLDPHPQCMDHGIEQPLAPTLGALAVARILWNVGNHTGIENALAIVR